MTWTDYHRREEAMRTVVELADRRRDGLLPWDETADTARVFDTPTDLLAALHMRWHTRLTGMIEKALADEPMDLESEVQAAWRRTATEMPGIRAILDDHLDSATLAKARRKEHMMLATMSGLAGIDDPRASRIGERIELEARAMEIPTIPTQRRSGVLARLRHVLEGAA